MSSSKLYNKKKIKFYNVNKGIGYAPIPQISPYSKVSIKRLKNTKFVFRKANEYATKYSKKPKTWLDVGTGNGEFLYFLSKKWKKTFFTGLDITNEFLNIAKKINANSNNVSFVCSDILKSNKKKFKFDVVTCIGTLQIFPDPTKILNKLLNLVHNKGILIIDGRINSYDVSTQIKFKDDSQKISENIWRCDYNLHSQKWITKILSKRTDIKKTYFKYPVMDTKIFKKKNAPDSHAWTIPNMAGGYEIINGLQIFHNPSFLIVKKK